MDTGKAYKATLDKSARWGVKYGTYSFFFILVASTLPFFIGTGKYAWCLGLAYIFFLSIAVYIYYLVYNIKEYILYEYSLVIKRPIANCDKKIILSDIEKAERFPFEQFKASRRISNISIFGYFGDYYHPAIGYYKMYATNLNNLIIITLKNSKNVVVSPDDISLLEALKK